MKRNCRDDRRSDRKGGDDLSIILVGFAEYLQARGYAQLTIQDYLRAARHFFRWLKSRRLTVEEASLEIIQSFVLRHLRRCQCPPPASRDPRTAGSALRVLFEMLQAHGIIPQSTAKLDSPSEQLVSRFDRYMVEVCGLAETTRSARRRAALEFLAWRFGNRPLWLYRIAAGDLVRFVMFRAKRLSPVSVRVLSDSLRSFLRFLQLEDHCPGGLEMAVPTLRARHQAKLPEVIDPDKLKAFLASFDRSTPMGRRDYAMALCMCDLGLRIGEVAQLSLEELDWHHSTLTLACTKQRRERKLPIPPRLARALAGYLRRGRPASNCRQVFLRHRTPVGTPLRNAGVRWAMRRAYDRVGIQATGTHLLRRTFATGLHQRGANLKLIADFLGHQDLGTVSVYTRVNLKQLRSLALPWPRA